MPSDADGLAKSTLPGQIVHFDNNLKLPVKRVLGQGSYGTVFSCLGNTRIVLKFERGDERHAQLEYESRVYNELDGSVGVPKCYGFTRLGDWKVLAMQRLGPTLEDVRVKKGAFSWDIACRVGAQLVRVVQSMHERGFIHRDIKPHNMCFPRGTRSWHDYDGEVYLFDFGLSKKYKSESGKHIAMREGKSVTGTPRFCSVAAHVGLELSRRDDLESLCYTMLYLSPYGKLPWQGLKTSGGKKERNAAIGKVKLEIPIRELLRKCPRGWKSFMKSVRRLSFDETPDYDALYSYMMSGVNGASSSGGSGGESKRR